MITFIVIAGVLIAFFLIFGKSKETETIQKTEKIKPDYSDLPTVAELVKKVNNVKDFELFEKEQEEVYKKYSEDFDNKYYEKLYNRYESAFAKIDSKLSDKIFYYQFVPYIDLDTPLKELNLAYSYCEKSEFQNKKRGTDSSDWQEITGSDLIGSKSIDELLEIKPDYFDSLVMFRQIVESKDLIENKIQKCIEILNQNPSLVKQFFKDPKSPLSLQCFEWFMAKYKIPKLQQLIELGYDDLKKLKSLTKEDLEAIKGFGPASIEKFLVEIKKIK